MRIRRATERWFGVPNDPDEAKVLIKALKPGTLQQIMDESTIQRTEYAKQDDGNIEPKIITVTDFKKTRELPILNAVVGWENFYDDNGEMEFSKDNLIRAIHEIEGFVEFITECRQRLDDDLQKEQGAQEKNS